MRVKIETNKISFFHQLNSFKIKTNKIQISSQLLELLK